MMVRRDNRQPHRIPQHPDHTRCIEQHDGYSVPTTIEQSRAALLVSSPFFKIISHVPMHNSKGGLVPPLEIYIYYNI